MSKPNPEYLRRNLIHASAVGAEATAQFALSRVGKWKRSPKWLVKSLLGIHERTVKVSGEMAAHRNEVRRTLDE